MPIPILQREHIDLEVLPDSQFLENIYRLFDIVVERHHRGVQRIVCQFHSTECSRKCFWKEM